jgi:hypothetical protein
LGKFTGISAGKDLPDVSGEVDGTDQHGIGLLLLQKAKTDFEGPIAAAGLGRNAETRSAAAKFPRDPAGDDSTQSAQGAACSQGWRRDVLKGSAPGLNRFVI